MGRGSDSNIQSLAGLIDQRMVSADEMMREMQSILTP